MANNYLKENKLLIIIIFIILVLLLGYYLFSDHLGANLLKEQEKDNDIIEINKEENLIVENDEAKECYYVDIKGAVVKPNVYCLENNSRIIDVIKAAGGLKKEADTSVLNLSKKIEDEMTIIVYTKTEIKKFKDIVKSDNTNEIAKYIENNNHCPDPDINQACINNDDNNNITNNKISINKANITLLQTLPGIGEAKALAIINYRNDNGLFTTIEDIKKVSGIGDSTFAQIKDYITV